MIGAIMCGGSGTRLWPASRESFPKPFIKLADGTSLLGKALANAAALEGVGKLALSTNRELMFLAKDEVREAPGARGRDWCFVLEPSGRNTAPAIACLAHAMLSQGADPSEPLLVMSADHLIEDLPAFKAAVARAGQLAAGGSLVVFGIKPTHGHTGYGYIEAEGEQVERFIEKPPAEQAAQYAASGRHLWNAGIFCARLDAWRRSLMAHAPEVWDRAREAVDSGALAQGEGGAGAGSWGQLELDAGSLARAPDISIDKAVLEKESDIKVVPCDIGWGDIGSWDAIGSLSDADEDGNRSEGRVKLLNSSNCFARSEGRLVALVGARDLVVVETSDAVLVAHKDHLQEVKSLAAELKVKGDSTALSHRRVRRPWGQFETLDEGPGFKVKRIEVRPGEALSLQSHMHRSERWIVAKGVALVEVDGESTSLRAGGCAQIPIGAKHRLSNPGKIDLVLIEVQSGEYLGEDDIVRYEDRYGRG